MKIYRNQLHWNFVLLVTTYLMSGCASMNGGKDPLNGPSDNINPPPIKAHAPANHIMVLNADGTFTSPSTGTNVIQIYEGDTVTFEKLEKTDGIVRTKSFSKLVQDWLASNDISPNTFDPIDLTVPIQSGGIIDICAALPVSYYAPGNVPDENEFTGPLRKGVSGIFSLGPMYKPNQTESFREYDLGTIKPPRKYNACLVGDPLQAIDSCNGHYYQLCRDNQVSNETMPVTFENPDIDGVIIRMNWKDIETNNGVFDYHQLDSQMNMAVKNGKVFTLDFRSGIYGMPDHEYSTNGGAVTPLEFRTVLSTSVTPPDCGTRKTLPSPSEQAYKDAYEDFLTNVINHVRSNTAWWQALAYFKLSGVNLNTSEGKTAHLCDKACGPAYCATKVWAEAENIASGLGWSPDRLYQYYREVGNTIYEETLHQKSIGFQLIQDGYPRAIQPDNYFVDGGDDGDTTDDNLLPKFDDQTVNILNFGQDGDFADRSVTTLDPVAGMAFVPQHSGLQTNPDDQYQGRDGLHVCAYNQPIVDDPNSQHFHMAEFPLTTKWTWGSMDNATTGCPNKWNRREGYEGQITGWQTNNGAGVANPNEVSSALFNATTNSNGVFVELYEERLWEIMHLRGTGPIARPVTDDKFATYFNYRKNMHQWSEEFHTRRKWLADNNVSNNPYLEDPFPKSYSHTFSKNLKPGEKETYWFISPYKCETGASRSLQRIGKIEVTGI